MPNPWPKRCTRWKASAHEHAAPAHPPDDPPTITLQRRTLALAFANAFGAGFLTAIIIIVLFILP